MRQDFLFIVIHIIAYGVMLWGCLPPPPQHNLHHEVHLEVVIHIFKKALRP